MKILMVLTCHGKLGSTGRKTGFWLEEFAAHCYVFKDMGAKFTLASQLGGQPPLDPSSDAASAQTDATHRLKNDAPAQVALANTRKLHDMKTSGFDAAFYLGGHGPLWDLAENAYSMDLIETILSTEKPVALVRYAPGVLRQMTGSDGNPIVKGKSVTEFSNIEEKTTGLTSAVPFSVENMLRQNGGHYAKADDWLPFVATDGLLVTGQNPASSQLAANALLKIAATSPKHTKETA